MNRKLLLLFLLTLLFVTASDPFFGTELRLRPLPNDQVDVKEVSWWSSPRHQAYLQDHDQRVSDNFKISPYYYPMVQFWFIIYTQLESTQVVIHDRSNLSLVYKVLDFKYLKTKGVPKNTIYVLQQKITEEKMKLLKDELSFLAGNPFSMEERALRIQQTLLKGGVNLPKPRDARRKLFLSLRDNLRSQTGQKDFIEAGIIRARPYHTFILKFFEQLNLPPELLAIPFLESSFNPRAHSRANAMGAWQFMPLIASYFVPSKVDHIDYRSNVGVSTVSAALLMSENFQIMKSWDLAVTAYNSGTKHLLKTKRELASEKVDLESIIKHSDSKHFGFASKNFYSEFLALAHVLAYQNDIFTNTYEDRQDVNDELRFYLTKCSLQLEKVLGPIMLEDVMFHNDHLDDIKRSLPRGFILTAKSRLPASKFLLLNNRQVTKYRPKEWNKFLIQSCSTK